MAAAPDFTPAWRGLAELLLTQGCWPDFEQALETLSRLPQGAAEADLLRARRHLAHQDFGPARRLLEKAIAARPADPRPRVLLTHALLQEGHDDAAAARALRELLALAPQEAESWRNLALLLRKQGRRIEAENACRSGLVQCPGEPPLRLTLGMVLLERGDLVSAETCLLGVLEAGGTDARSRERALEARHLLALTLRGQGRSAEAAAQWRALVAEEPAAWGAWAALGETCLSLGRLAEADMVLTRLGDRPEAALLRVRLHLERQEYAAARALVADLIAQAPRALAPRLLLSYAWLADGSDPAAAEDALRDVLELDPGNAEAAHNLAVLRQHRGRAAG